MLLITGMPRSGTSYTQRFFSFAYKAGDKRYYAPDQEEAPDEMFCGRGSLLEDGLVYQCLYGNRHEDIPEVLSQLEENWKEYGEPVLKHPLLLCNLDHLQHFSRVVITYCNVDNRWLESIDNQFGRDTIVNNQGDLFGADDILDLGMNWREACLDAELICPVPVSMIEFGDEAAFRSVMTKDLGYDEQLVNEYWSQWRGSRFNQ